MGGSVLEEKSLNSFNEGSTNIEVSSALKQKLFEI
jgi:hypothetical protein